MMSINGLAISSMVKGRLEYKNSFVDENFSGSFSPMFLAISDPFTLQSEP